MILQEILHTTYFSEESVYWICGTSARLFAAFCWTKKIKKSLPFTYLIKHAQQDTWKCAWAHIRFYISALELLSLCVMLINSISLRICLVRCSVWTVYRICQHTHPSSISRHLSTLHDDSIYKVAQSWWRKANNVAIPEYNSGSNLVLFSLSCFCCLWWGHYFSGDRISCLRPTGLLGRRFFLTWRSLMWWKCMEGFQIGRWEPIGGKWLITGCVCMLVSVKAVPNIRQTLQNHLAAHYASLNHNKLYFQLLVIWYK